MPNTLHSRDTNRRGKFTGRWFLRSPIWILLITLGVVSSYNWNYQILEKHAMSLALERGRYTFKIIEATRLWVAQHGVAYVAISDATPSNPYLEIAEKNITTPSGVKLTAINPAYMTRQLTGILKRKYEMHAHITSLKPINPDNKADPWEAKSLAHFEQEGGSQVETFELINGEKNNYARYMAPLYVKPTCMKCHEKQGYKVGDVRGGISVSFDFKPFISWIADQRQNFLFIHMVVWIVLSLSTIIILKLVRHHETAIEKGRDEAEVLVEERTKELQKALNEIKVLKGIIPICSYCHKVRDDEGAWERMDSYITKHSDASFSHGICPDCLKTVRSEGHLDKGDHTK